MTTPLIDELRSLIVTRLQLEGVAPGDIDPAAPLFGEGLGLDSIDALELAAAVEETYGFPIAAGAPENPRIFASVDALARHVEAHRVPR